MLATPSTASKIAVVDVRDSDHIGGHIRGSTWIPAHELDVLGFFNEKRECLTSIARRELEARPDSRVKKLARTADGKGLAVLRRDGIDLYAAKREKQKINLRYLERVTDSELIVVLAGGSKVLVYSEISEELLLLPSASSVRAHISRITRLFCLKSNESSASLVAVAPDSSIFRVQVSGLDELDPVIKITASPRLPLESPPKLVFPASYVPWHSSKDDETDEMLQSFSEDGTLSFLDYTHEKTGSWICSGKVKTGRTKIPTLASCNASKKTAMGLFFSFLQMRF